MCIAVASDWQTGAETTRPIVPSVAHGFYGNSYKDIPYVTVHPDGYVQTIDLKNGQTIAIPSPAANNQTGPKPDLS